MRDIVWSNKALDDFDNAIYFIAKSSPQSALLVASRVELAIGSLAEIPTGRPGRVKGTYERVVQGTPYIVAYTLSTKTVGVVRIIHGSRNWQDDEWPAE